MTLINLQRAVWLFLASLLCLTFMLPQAVHAQNPQLRQIFGQLSATPTVRANFQQQKNWLQ